MLKILRASKGLTQKDVSKLLHVKQYNICDWERGRSTPNTETLIKLANIYEVSLDDLLGNKKTPEPTSSSSAINEYVKDLHTLKIIRRIENLDTKEKEQLYNTIDTIIKTMFGK